MLSFPAIYADIVYGLKGTNGDITATNLKTKERFQITEQANLLIAYTAT